MSKEKYSFTTCDFDRLRHIHYKQFYISTSDWKNKAIELKTVNYDFTTDLTTFTLEIKRNRGKR